MSINFIHLRLHSEFSIHDGLVRLPALMEKAVSLNMPAVAVTDLGNLYAAVKFYKEAFKAGVKPIIGVDLRLANPEKTQSPFRLTLLCQNNLGYQNLLKIVSRSFLEGQETGVPIIQAEWLQGLSEGLIALSGAQEGDIAQALLEKNQTTAKKRLKAWLQLFPDRFYIEISRVGKENESAYIAGALKLAETFSVPVVASNDVRFLEAEDFEAHEARVCIQQGITLADPNRSRDYTDQQYFRSQEEMQALFSDIPEALANTVEVAKRCNVLFDLGINKLPHFPVPEQYSTESYLEEVAVKGLRERLQTYYDAVSTDIDGSRGQAAGRRQTQAAGRRQTQAAGQQETQAEGRRQTQAEGRQETQAAERQETQAEGRQETQAEGRQETQAEGRQETQAAGRQETLAEGRRQTQAEGRQETQAAERRLYDERLQRELGVINKMGFAGYFLIVADFTKWAKENGIPVGPGRGSGPGSVVAWALKITDLDPLALDLLFERFLNPERVSMPDFDIDFCMEGRDRVIEYVMKTHGYDCVSQIITYGTMAAKAVVRDVGRVLGLSYGFVDKIAKLIPFELGITLDLAMQQEPLLRERYEQEEEVKTLIDLARKLEGATRNVGKHAGGIVIAPGKLTDFVPLYCEPGEAEHPVTQFDKDDVEAVGLVKFDFLGLKTLTIIDRAIHTIHEQQKEKNETLVDINLIPLQDEKTFTLLKACQSTAVFQLESHGMRDLIKRLQPDCFEDLIALVALFRPGPLQSGMVDDFINRKHGRSRVVYPHPKLEPVLSPTYGVILYQEQVMQIAQVLAGYTLGAADILRRAMGKKKPEEMAKQREIFCSGAVKNGVDEELANQIFDLMEKFAGYGFNKSHSASYALIAYQTAWLKAHYPAAFMAAVLSSDMDKTDKVINFLDDCETQKLQVSPPDINKSEYFFKVINDEHLMYGFGAIKGVGEGAIENIINARKEKGNFKDLFDFCERVDLRKVNRRTLESLIKSGCFDSLGEDRAVLVASVNKAIQHAEQVLHNQTHGQHDLLSMTTTTSRPAYESVRQWDEEVRLQGEKETLGFYLTGHPLNYYLNELKHLTTCRINELHPVEHKNACVAAIISSIRTRQTKRGDRIAIFSLDDGTGHIEAVCFSEPFQKYRHLLQDGQLLLVEGEVSIDDFSNGVRLTCREIYTFDQIRDKRAKALMIPVKKLFDLEVFKQLLTPHLGGNCPVILRYLKDNIQADFKLGQEWLVTPSDALIKLIKEQLTEQPIEILY